MDQDTLSENIDVDLSHEDQPSDNRLSLQDQLSQIWDKGMSERDDSDKAPPKPRTSDGKFAKTEPQNTPNVEAKETTAATAPAPAKKEGGEDTAPEGTPAVETPSSNFKAPNTWRPQAAAELAKASPLVQQEVLKREQDAREGIAHYKQAAEYGQQMYKTIEPFKDIIKQIGVTPEVAIRQLFTAHHRLSTSAPQERVQLLSQLAKSYGIDLSQGIPEQQPIDPNVQYFQQQQAQQMQVLQQTQAEVARLNAVQAQREDAELQNMIAQASQGKEYFNELAPDIGTLLQASVNAGQPLTLEEAYDRAVWASPKHRDLLLAKRQEEYKAQEVQRIADQNAKAQAAKKASSLNVQKRGLTIRPGVPKKSAAEAASDMLSEKYNY